MRNNLPAKVFPRLLLWQIIAAIAVVGAIGLFLQSRNTTERPARPITQLTMKLPGDMLIPIGTTGVNISSDGKFMSFAVQSGLGVKVVLRQSDREVLKRFSDQKDPEASRFTICFLPTGSGLLSVRVMR